MDPPVDIFAIKSWAILKQRLLSSNMAVAHEASRTCAIDLGFGCDVPRHLRIADRGNVPHPEPAERACAASDQFWWFMMLK
jgi:hypothetical protein